MNSCTRACAGMVAGMLTLSMAACSRGRDDSTPPDFFPLHADDTWVYDVVRPMRNERSRMTVRVRGDRYVGVLGQQVRLVDESYADEQLALGIATDQPAKPEIYPIAYYRKNGFLYRALSLEYNGSELRDVGLGSSEERFLPDGLSSDVTWDSMTTAYDLGGGNSYGVRQTHQTALEGRTIDVPAGHFTGCVRVDTVALHGGQKNGKSDSNPIVLYYSDWYAPNVGLVRTIESNRPDGGPPLAQIELVAFDVEGTRP